MDLTVAKGNRRTFLMGVGSLFAFTLTKERLPLYDPSDKIQLRLVNFRGESSLTSLGILKESIEKRGVIERVVVDNGTVVSGVRRLVACLELHAEGRLVTPHIPAFFIRPDGPPENGFIDIRCVDPNVEPMEMPS